MNGIYAGVPYEVREQEGKFNIAIPAGIAAGLLAQGADMTLLDNIGDQDPEDVMEALFDSIPAVDENKPEPE